MSPTRLSFALFSIALFAQCSAQDAAAAFQSHVMPTLASTCVKCHGPEKQKAKINLSGPRTLDQLSAEQHLWFRVLDQIESGNMPPDDADLLPADKRQAIAAWIRGELTDLLAARQTRDGRSRLRRLSRNEYANTIDDLFGFRPPVGRELPADGRVDGFDKVSAALPLSSSGANGYFTMTELVLSRALRLTNKPTDGQPGTPPIRAVARPSEQSKGHILELDDGTMVSFNTDMNSGPLKFGGARLPGIHKLKLSVYAYQTDKPLPFGIYAGHTGAYPQLVELIKVLEAPPGKPTVLETEIYLRTNDVNDLAPISDSFRLVPFGLGVPVPKNAQASSCKGPGLAVQWVDIEEPALPLLGSRWLTADFPESMLTPMQRYNATVPKPAGKAPPKGPTRDEFLTAMQKTIKRISPRLYRRDLTDAEFKSIMDSVTKQADAGATMNSILFDHVSALMTAPDFFCIVEPPGKLNDFALASRLAYFLWNSTPDETLLDVARCGKLKDPKILREQTERLLADPKSNRFVNDFADQWLGLRMINDTSPDSKVYPEYDELLKISSVWETQGTLRRILAENLSVRDFVAPNWSLVNERLAKHYGLPPLAGIQLQKVALPKDSPYGGLWTQAAVMKVTANGTATSPVKRGVWMVERLLGISIPPPPPNINPVEPDIRGAKTLREQLALHSGKGSCAACHAKFDPYGFALESFDVMGNFRTKYRDADPNWVKLPPNERKGSAPWHDGLPVDCSGKMPGGAAFSGIAELRTHVAQNPEQLARGVVRHLVTYSTGAPATSLDQKAIDAIVASASKVDYGFRSLIHALVQSDLFKSK